MTQIYVKLTVKTEKMSIHNRRGASLNGSNLGFRVVVGFYFSVFSILFLFFGGRRCSGTTLVKPTSSDQICLELDGSFGSNRFRTKTDHFQFGRLVWIGNLRKPVQLANFTDSSPDLITHTHIYISVGSRLGGYKEKMLSSPTRFKSYLWHVCPSLAKWH